MSLKNNAGVDWFFSIVRIAGTAFPVASSLVQLHAEIDSKALLARVVKLEDPVSNLHEDVPELSRQIFQKMKSENSSKLYFSEEFHNTYSRALAVLKSHGYIEGGNNFVLGIRLIDPSYVMYMCALEEDGEKMKALFQVIESCKIREWLDGKDIKSSIGLPLPVIQAAFDIYESQGYGRCSKIIGLTRYLGIA